MESPTASSDRLAELAADYAKFKLNPDLPGPARESYAKFEKPDRRGLRSAGDGWSRPSRCSRVRSFPSR